MSEVAATPSTGNETGTDVDVVIVGAGVSGLATARGLLEGGRSVAILEARDRTGGRLRSTASGLDLGASWFWPGETRVARLIADAGVPTHPQHLAGDAVYDDRTQVVRLDGNPIDVVSSRFSTGADSLTDALADMVGTHHQARIALGTSVEHIEIGERVRVRSSGPDGPSTTTATHVVLALPPALAISSIAFDPAMPDEIAALASATPVWMGAITKVVAVYPTPFWRAAGLSGAAISHRGPMREIHDMSGPNGAPPALFGFAPTTASSGPVRPDDLLDQLARLFGPAAAEPLELHITDWRTDPATSPPRVETITNHATFGDARFGRGAFDGHLHWTSTETGHVAPGHIEGALAAAERTVQAITANPEPTVLEQTESTR